MQHEMFKMLQFIDSSSTDGLPINKGLPEMTEADVREVYLLLKRKKIPRNPSTKKYEISK